MLRKNSLSYWVIRATYGPEEMPKEITFCEAFLRTLFSWIIIPMMIVGVLTAGILVGGFLSLCFLSEVRLLQFLYGRFLAFLSWCNQPFSCPIGKLKIEE